MFEGDLNEDRREAKHDGARIVRNVWKAQPTWNSEGFYKTGKMLHWTPFPGQNRELGDEMTPRLDSKPAAEGDRRLPDPVLLSQPSAPLSSKGWAKLALSPFISQLNRGLQRGVKPFSGLAPDREVFSRCNEEIKLNVRLPGGKDVQNQRGVWTQAEHWVRGLWGVETRYNG